MTFSLIFAAIALLIVFWAVGAYRRLSRQRKRCKAAFMQADTQMKRRHELIPNLLETAKGYMKGTRDALQAVIAAHNKAVAAREHAGRNVLDATVVARISEAETALGNVLSNMVILMQLHSELVSDQNIRQLTDELNAVESKLGFARQVYNEAATQYNSARAQFPGSVIAVVFAFTPVALLQHAHSF